MMKHEERERGPRQEKAESALRQEEKSKAESVLSFEEKGGAESALRVERKGKAEVEANEPDTPKHRPSWKKTSARMLREQEEQAAEAAASGNSASTQEQAGAEYAPTELGAYVPEDYTVADDTPPPEAPPDSAGSVTSGQSVPKYRQYASEVKFRQESSQPAPADKLHQNTGATHQPPGGGSAGPKPFKATATNGGASVPPPGVRIGGSGSPVPEPGKLRKARERMEHQNVKLDKARDKLSNQKPVKSPGSVKQAAGFAGRAVEGYIHGKIYEVEHENVGTESAHRVELAAEAVGRGALHFTKQRIRTHPARAVTKAERKAVKATADYRFRQTMLEHPEMEKKNAVIRAWRKRQQRKAYQKQAYEAAKQSAKAAETGGGAIASNAKRAGRAVLGFVKRHPMGAVIALLCVLLVLVLQSCASSLTAVGNSLTGSVAATTFPASDADLLGAEAAYSALEAALKSRLDNYESTHDYDEYKYSLGTIEHDPYVLLSILSALHPEGWTLADVEADLQAIFAKQYILTETVTDKDGSVVTTTSPDGYYICNVKLENFNLSHLPVYILSEEQLSRYVLYIRTLGNRPDLFPGSSYVGIYGGIYPNYGIPPEALADEQFAAMIKEAETYIGYPYVWGGSSPRTSFDCSGFVCWVVNNCGVGWNVGRTTAEGLRQLCAPVSYADAKPGDLIFFEKTYNTPGASHVGIYVGNNTMLHCGNPIRYVSIETSYWQSHLLQFGRLPSVN